MKNILIILSLIVFNVFNAQDCFEQKQKDYGVDSSECNKNVNLYQLHLKQTNWTYSSIFWWNTIKACPQFSQKVYKNGTIIYKKIIAAKTKEKSEEVDTYVDTLFMVYDLWFENYGICEDVVLRSSRDKMKFRAKTDYETVYSDFKSVYASNKKLYSYSDVNMFFYSAIYMFNNKKIDCDVFLNDYENMSDLCDMNIKSGKKVEQFKKVQIFLDNSINPCASCDKLEEIYSVKLQKDSTNMELTKKVFDILSAKKCTESEFYLELLDKVLNDPDNPPTAKDLINAALADHKRKDYNKAKERFTKALDITEDEELKQKCYTYLYDISFKRKKYKEAFNLASSFTDNCLANDKKARAIASSASTCGTSPFERSLIYCLALDYAEKSCGNTNSSTTNAWKGLLLPKKELIMLDITNGSEQTVPCWNKSVILRTRD